MAMRAPEINEARPSQPSESRSKVPPDDPLLLAMRNAPLITDPTDEELEAIEEFRRMKQRGNARRP